MIKRKRFCRWKKNSYKNISIGEGFVGKYFWFKNEQKTKF
ncbi:hypothetical protein LEP1GSC150_3570 [Leptospira interrogans serovar Copenhageni str. LT2050]|uniref:Uncharacterized protein n=1 Tax=Leptospira interrogans serovar Copenhageni str. LT2050 TaxID=1001598 RepID=M3HFB4_LEPIT|nr:hypothetical protein LEP1GSC150_3570 [Leptospira interrogans serovar Copenhageni str. LT2050]